jgi:Domain of unknown function (DUF4286)
MYYYNVSIKITKDIREEWLTWMKEEHIADVLATNLFTSATLTELLEPIDDDAYTFVVQYYAESKAAYNAYIEKHAPVLREKGFAKFGNKFIAFRTLMQELYKQEN